jgi:hypothetical protein
MWTKLAKEDIAESIILSQKQASILKIKVDSMSIKYVYLIEVLIVQTFSKRL